MTGDLGLLWRVLEEKVKQRKPLDEGPYRVLKGVFSLLVARPCSVTGGSFLPSSRAAFFGADGPAVFRYW